MKDIVRTKLVPQLRKELASLTPALINEHGKDLQHAPGTDPSSGTSTPSKQAQAEKKDTAAPAATSTKTTTSKVAVNTATVKASDEFRTTAEELYTTFTDPQRIAAFTRAPPRQFDGAHVGGKFSIFDGNVNGEYVKLEPPALMVQKWRLAQWPEGHFSTLEIKFDQNDMDGVTQMRVTWTGVPVGQEDITKTNWENYYVRSMKQAFGYVPAPPCPLTLLSMILSFGFLALPNILLARSPGPFSSRWRQILIFLSVLFVGVGLALFYDRLQRWMMTLDAGTPEA